MFDVMAMLFKDLLPCGMSRERLSSASYKRSRVQSRRADFLLEIFSMLSAAVVLLSQLHLYFCAANSIYEGPCDYVNDSATHGAIIHTVRTYLEDALNFNDNGIPYGCKAIKCSLKGGAGIDVEVSCAIGKSSAMLTTYFLKRHFDDYFETLHSTLRWDNEMAENALNYNFVKDKIKEGYLWSEVPREISRVDYYEVSDLVKEIIPTLFDEKEKETVIDYC
ncbi:unnamed protein product [Nippostrongylus brasiliensis]|uniref:Uncharacterized protein n=1 Tax=Nippostrongylus brasiliensis TaxID=27835 RepID=A0A158R1K4_NIPBR|nr:unnamed protein product [Nippostrongylus brasiliensis]